MKRIYLKFPEYYLIILTFLAGYSPPFYINPIFVVIVIILILQIVFKNRILGLVLGSLFFLVNLFFLAALISELNEFTKINTDAKQLLLVGLSIWITNMLMSLVLIYKYSTLIRAKDKTNSFIV